MNDERNLDIVKLKEMMNEIVNLKRYSSNLANNTKGERLENYIDNLNKSINALENKIELIYDEKSKGQ